MNKTALIFPHQLFLEPPVLLACKTCYLIEENLFFKEFEFHKQKLAFHRASMQYYNDYLTEKGHEVLYVSCFEKESDIRELISKLASQSVDELHFINPTDNWLEKRLKLTAEAHAINLVEYENSLFLNSRDDLSRFFHPDKKSFFQTTFYKQERKKRNLLLDMAGEPIGGKWSFDKENRKKYPSKRTPPSVQYPDVTPYWNEAATYVERQFGENPGSLPDSPTYPINHEQSQVWLKQFLEQRFFAFGDFEDAIVKSENILHHSVLSPLLNVGLISPEDLIEQTLNFAANNDIPINSTEGFLRQIIGWREFIRGMYEAKGSYMRTRNFWQFNRKIPDCMYDGTTGIPPIDSTIKKVLQTGYCHHIERLMVLGNFMLLCEFDPREVYRWFMELFIDAYDWVMVPNVYGMSQFSDGGTFATKPYISGSNYLVKMSDYEKGPWQKIWDGLFWRFMYLHRDFFTANPRLSMLVGMLDKMPKTKLETHLLTAENFLNTLDSKQER